MSPLRSGRKHDMPRVEINIVPLVDVSLVLLIIFMVTATFIKSAGMHIQLPTSSTAYAGNQAKKEIVVGISSNGEFLWEGSKVSASQLQTNLMDYAKKNGTDVRVTIQGDKMAAHGRVVDAMSMAQRAGFGKLVIAVRVDSKRDANAL